MRQVIAAQPVTTSRLVFVARIDFGTPAAYLFLACRPPDADQ
jgi:hypothetical protein